MGKCFITRKNNNNNKEPILTVNNSLLNLAHPEIDLYNLEFREYLHIRPFFTEGLEKGIYASGKQIYSKRDLSKYNPFLNIFEYDYPTIDPGDDDTKEVILKDSEFQPDCYIGHEMSVGINKRYLFTHIDGGNKKIYLGDIIKKMLPVTEQDTSGIQLGYELLECRANAYYILLHLKLTGYYKVWGAGDPAYYLVEEIPQYATIAISVEPHFTQNI